MWREDERQPSTVISVLLRLKMARQGELQLGAHVNLILDFLILFPFSVSHVENSK